jgi:hypothetical protein
VRTNQGPGRVLVAVYGVFAISAGARSGFQVAQSFDAARLAYSLSVLAAVVYLVATLSLAGVGPRPRLVAWTAVGVELVGVLVVGTVSAVDPGLFPDETVWSGFGTGYGYVPLVLPLAGLGWLWWTRRPYGTGER